jgi:flagellar basal-body rod protein FlgF
MSGLVEAASAILRASERRLESTSRNVANITTPGYKRQIGFSDLLSAKSGEPVSLPAIGLRSDFSPGKLSVTGNPLDIAISGDGFFQLRDGETTFYSRQGQFSRAADGTLVTPQGYILQQAGGSDVIVDRAAVTIEQDGTIVDDGRPVARIGVYVTDHAAALRALEGSAFQIDAGHATEVVNPVVRQGMLEASNVSIGDEMVTMMSALRQAESGSRLVQTYDDLLGRAITTFGQGGQ